MRWWNESVAALEDITPGGVPMLAFLSLVATLIIALAWYFWPHWLPWHWRFRDGSRRGRSGRSRRESGGRRFRLGAMRWRWRWRRRRRKRSAEALTELPPDELPDLPAAVLALTADQLAEAGRYAEAVRERLRSIVRGLIEHGLIPFSPGWTVTELAAAATRIRPELAGPLDAAVGVFSAIWYGLRVATAADDREMRGHASDVSAILAAAPAAAVSTAAGAGTGVER
jgi:hypothetical protein